MKMNTEKPSPHLLDAVENYDYQHIKYLIYKVIIAEWIIFDHLKSLP